MDFYFQCRNIVMYKKGEPVNWGAGTTCTAGYREWGHGLGGSEVRSKRQERLCTDVLALGAGVHGSPKTTTARGSWCLEASSSTPHLVRPHSQPILTSTTLRYTLISSDSFESVSTAASRSRTALSTALVPPHPPPPWYVVLHSAPPKLHVADFLQFIARSEYGKTSASML